MTKRQNIYFIYVHLIGNQINWFLCLFLQYSLKVKKQFEMTFIDFKKAFDSIHRGKMMRILKAYGIPPNLLQAIEKMYTNTKAKVISPDGETEIARDVRHHNRCAAGRHISSFPVYNRARLCYEKSYGWERRRAGIYHHPSKIKKTP